MIINLKNLIDDFIEQGTMSEPKGISIPFFPLSATVNWMHALRIIVNSNGFDSMTLLQDYTHVAPIKFEDYEKNTVLEQLLSTLHYCSTLQSFSSVPNKSDIVRIGIITWYYGLYSAASAMIAAKVRSIQDNHNSSANSWNRHIVENKLIKFPFDVQIKSLVKKDSDDELIKRYNYVTKYAIAKLKPQDVAEASQAVYSYLSGTTNWWREKLKDEIIRNSKEFKKLKVDNFLKKAAREILNARLKDKGICFLHQAIRYRGKANYRDTVFLGYKIITEEHIEEFIDDLSTVLNAFASAAGTFCSKRLGKDIWNKFLEDVEKNRSFTLSPYNLWSQL